MANQVYANGREIACKASTGKSICAFPDVCLSPPSPPAGPVPIPYPNTGMATDTTSGSKTVTAHGKEIMLKDRSFFKKSTGDEAATKSLGMGVVTHQIQGKVYFVMWSFNVKVEGENVVRHLDIMTHNHNPPPGNTPPWPFMGAQAVTQAMDQEPGSCKDEINREREACGDLESDTAMCGDAECQKARKCMLVPYKRKKGKQAGCCDKKTPHHLVEVHCFTESGGRARKKRLQDFEKYDDEAAPCICVSGTRYSGEHGDLHSVQGMWERKQMDSKGKRSQKGGLNGKWTYAKAKGGVILAIRATFPDSNCSAKCTNAQLDAYHRRIGIENKTPLRADRSPLKAEQKDEGAEVIRGRAWKKR